MEDLPLLTELDAELNDLVADLKPLQVKALNLVVQGLPFRQIAKMVGVHERVLWQWRQLPEFARALNAIHAWSVGQVARRLYSSHHVLFDEIQDILDEAKRTHDMKLRVQALKLMQGLLVTAARVGAAAANEEMRERLERVEAVLSDLTGMSSEDLDKQISAELGA